MKNAGHSNACKEEDENDNNDNNDKKKFKLIVHPRLL
jgi:hypothetical protein